MYKVVVYDQAATDEKSKVRGVGRYIETLREAFATSWEFEAGRSAINHADILIHPFYNPIAPPFSFKKKARYQIAIIHDLIPLKYPHYFPLGLKNKIFKFLNKILLGQFDLIVTDSEESKKSIIQILRLPPEKIKVIYATVPHVFVPHFDSDGKYPFHKENGRSVADFTSLTLESVSQNPVFKGLSDYVIYVGDGTWNKNLENMAYAVEAANLTCVCVGKTFVKVKGEMNDKPPHPWQKSLYKFLSQTNANSHFIFPGYVNMTELLMLYKKAKVNILVSHDEGFGLSYIEAGYTATPSLLADRPIFHEIAGDAAVFANPENPKEMAQKLAALYFDNIKREKMSIEAFDRAQNYHPDRFKNEWTKVIENVTQKI